VKAVHGVDTNAHPQSFLSSLAIFSACQGKAISHKTCSGNHWGSMKHDVLPFSDTQPTVLRHRKLGEYRH